ncbi:MAG TPA: hypothetical protein VGN17_10980 [Bryobacteraceae bacterium]
MRTFFKGWAWVALLCTWPVTAAPVTGKVELRDSQDASVRKKSDYSGVVVWLEPLGAKAALPPAGHARMEQRNKTFTPHILAIPVGTTVDFPNFDPIFHNAFSNYDGKPFDLGLYPPHTSKGVAFTRVGIVRVFCNIHSQMSAVIVVLDTPYFTVTKKDGSYDFGSVPAGEYRLHVFHERATQATLEGAGRRVAVGQEAVMVPAIPISESGYIAIPHMNKFGHEYPPAPDELGVYPAVRK